MDEIVTKVRLITEGFNVGYNDTLGNYYAANFDYFYHFFNDSDKETRKHAFFLFMYLLGNVYAGHKGVLPRQHNETHENPNTTYIFEHYLQAFMRYHKELQNEFPVIYHFTIYYLNNLEETLDESYETYFSDIPKEVFHRLRTEVIEPNKQMKEIAQLPKMKYLLREINIEPFFKSDFI
ncbi:MAG: hypothetical protein ABS935_01905 [Solibacillus sp.]|uniref:hypothetical protein n=1 Tax=Solibacillus sp. TaxID=1909654 RepID=UPI0033152149